MFKRIIAMVVIGAALAACGLGTSHAGTPTSVVNATGTVVYGTEAVLSIEKDTTSGNRVKVKYPTGYQYADDDAAWSRYALFTRGLYKPVLVPNSTVGLALDTAKVIYINCSVGGSYVVWINAPSETIPDNCAFANAAKQ